MSTQASDINKSPKKRLLLLVLILSIFAVFTFAVILSTLLEDIATSLNVSIGTASQLNTVDLFMGLIMGIAMSFLAIKFKHKSLLVLGFAFFAIGVLGSYFAPNFASMVIFQVIKGMGGSMVTILVFTFVGEFLPLKERGWAMGLVFTGIFGAYVLVPPLSSSIAGLGSWRSVLIWFVLPFSIACMILSWAVIPSKPEKEDLTAKPNFRNAFKQILLNRSAMACLVSTALVAAISLVPVYAVTFYRIVFLESRNTAALFSSISAVAGVLGAAVGGRMVNRFGRKPLSIVAAFVSGVFAVMFTLVSNVWISVAFWAICAGVLGISASTLGSLVLEQVPGLRGSMMSFQNIFRNIGLVLGLAVSGLLLNLYSNNFQLLMVIYGSCGIASALVILVARDPCTNEPL